MTSDRIEAAALEFEGCGFPIGLAMDILNRFFSEPRDDRIAKSKRQPLRARTIALCELQTRTLNVSRFVKFQLRKPQYAGGKTAEEFIEDIIDPFAFDIHADRGGRRMHRKRARNR